MLRKAVSLMLLILAVAAFCMPGLSTLRGEHYYDVALSEMASGDRQVFDGNLTASEEWRERVARLKAAASAKGEIWFLFNGAVWTVVGCGLMVSGLLLSGVMRVQSGKSDNAKPATLGVEKT